MRTMIAFVGLFTLSLLGCGPERTDIPLERDDNTLENATYCVNGLGWAHQAGLIDAERSALLFPWAITREGNRITCSVTEGGELAHIVVDVRCGDEDSEVCAALISAKGQVVEGHAQPSAG